MANPAGQAIAAALDAVKAAAPEIEAPKQPARRGSASPKRLLGRIKDAVVSRLSGSAIFDAQRTYAAPAPSVMGIRPLPKPNLPEGFDLDEPPSTPDPQTVPSVDINAFDIPGAKTAGGIFDAGPKVLQADPANAASVEKALRAMIDQDPENFEIKSAELATEHVRLVKGHGDLADTIYVYFKQKRDNITVNGSYLSFTVKVINGKPILMAAMAKLFPKLAVETKTTRTEDQLKALAEQRLPENSGITLVFDRRLILYSNNAWHTVNLYDVNGLPNATGVKVAVDIATGEVFAWDSRLGVLSGKVDGRGESDDNRPGGQAALKVQPLPHLEVSLPKGQKALTDSSGRFSASLGEEPATFTATLSGSYAQVIDKAGKPLTITASLQPGQETTVVFNPEGADELTFSQVNAFLAVNRVHDWVKSHGLDDARLDRAIPVNVNINDECNAYYTPGRPSLNFFRSSENCSDTARPGVAMHEYGHFVDDMIGGIVNGGLSEGWGDTFSMYILKSPVIGEGFLKNREPSWIRHGENNYQYSANDEVHDQGQAWMGFTWKLRKALIASLDEAAGAAMAEALVIPTMFAKAADIPAAMSQVLLNGMDKNGNIKHEREIREAARAHGVPLPKNPGLGASLLGWVGRRWAGLKIRAIEHAAPIASQAEGQALAGPETAGAEAPAASAAKKAPVVMRTTVTLTGSRSAIEQVRGEIMKALFHGPSEYEGLRLIDLKENPGLLRSDLQVLAEGPQKSMAYFVEQIRRMSGR